jgi:hypothetical protein
MKNGNDGKPWTELDVRALMAALRVGETIEEAADHLCRSGSLNDAADAFSDLGWPLSTEASRRRTDFRSATAFQRFGTAGRYPSCQSSRKRGRCPGLFPRTITRLSRRKFQRFRQSLPRSG